MSDDGRLPESHMGVKLLAHLYDVPDGAITCLDSYQQYIYCGFSTGQVQKFYVSFDRSGGANNKRSSSDKKDSAAATAGGPVDHDDDHGTSNSSSIGGGGGGIENISTTLIASMSCGSSRTAKVKALHVTPTSDNLLFVLYKRVLSVYDATSFYKLREVATEVFTFCVSLRSSRNVLLTSPNNTSSSSTNFNFNSAASAAAASSGGGGGNSTRSSGVGGPNGGGDGVNNVYRICCSLKEEKRVLIHEFTPASNLLTRMEDNFLFPEQVLTLVEYGGVMCVGMSREYSIVGVDGDVRSLLSLNPGEHLPTISLHESNVFLLLNHLLFCVNIKSMPTGGSSARSLPFDYPPQVFTARHGAVFSFSQECCEVFGMYDDDIFQRLPVQDVRYVSDKAFFNKQVGHVILCASQKRIWLMEMFSLREQLRDLMDRYKVDDAFDLLDRHGYQEDESSLEAEVKIMGGFAHLKNCAPFDAIALFNSLLDPREVLRYVPCLIPARSHEDSNSASSAGSSGSRPGRGPTLVDTSSAEERAERAGRRKKRLNAVNHLRVGATCGDGAAQGRNATVDEMGCPRRPSRKRLGNPQSARHSQLFFEFKMSERRKRSIAYTLNGAGLRYMTSRQELASVLGPGLTDMLLEMSTYDALEDPLESIEGLFWRPYHVAHEQHDPDLSHGLERSWENVWLQLPEYTSATSSSTKTNNMTRGGRGGDRRGGEPQHPALLYYSTYTGQQTRRVDLDSSGSSTGLGSGHRVVERHVHPKYGPLTLPHFIEVATTELTFELITWLCGVRLDPCLEPAAKRGVDYALVVLYTMCGNTLGLLRLICSEQEPHTLITNTATTAADMSSAAFYPSPEECFQGTLQDCVPLLAGMGQWRALYVLLRVRGLHDIAENLWRARVSLKPLLLSEDGDGHHHGDNSSENAAAAMDKTSSSSSSYVRAPPTATTTSAVLSGIDAALPQSVLNALRYAASPTAMQHDNDVDTAASISASTIVRENAIDVAAHPIFFAVEAAVPAHITEVVGQYGTECLQLRDPDGNTPLHVACAMLRDPQHSQSSSLHQSSSSSSLHSAPAPLYSAQAHPLHPSPADFVASNESDRASRRLLTVISLLVNFGASPHETNNAELSPLDVAARLCPSSSLYALVVGTLCSAAIEKHWLSGELPRNYLSSQ